jgi:hypothetical protein
VGGPNFERGDRNCGTLGIYLPNVLCRLHSSFSPLLELDLLYHSEIFQHFLFLPRLLGSTDSQLFGGVARRVLLRAAVPVALTGAAEAVFTTTLLRHTLQLLVRPRGGHFSSPLQ